MLLLKIAMWVLLEMAESQPKPQPPAAVTFANDVQPILEKRCTPCHFSGGVMHAKLPFDKPDTIHKLGTKLFTRIKRDDEQKVIRAFLASGAAPSSSAPPSSRAPGR